MPADFSGEDVVERHMARLGRDPLMQSIRDSVLGKAGSPDLDAALKEYGARLPKALEPQNPRNRVPRPERRTR